MEGSRDASVGTKITVQEYTGYNNGNDNASNEGRTLIQLLTCDGCKAEIKTSEMQKFYSCPRLNCGHLTPDYFRNDLMSKGDLFGVPVLSRTQEEAMDIFNGEFICLEEEMDVDGIMNVDIVKRLWEIKNRAVKVGLFIEDNCEGHWRDHAGLRDAFMNCKTAVKRKDKVGFRNAFYTLMYMDFVGCMSTGRTRKRKILEGRKEHGCQQT